MKVDEDDKDEEVSSSNKSNAQKVHLLLYKFIYYTK